MASSTAVVVGASPTSSAALRMSDCSLGLLPVGKWTSPKGSQDARRMSDCQLRPNPLGSGLSKQVVIPSGVPDCERAQAWLSSPPHRVHKFLCTGPLVISILCFDWLFGCSAVQSICILPFII
uniref:Uncharacterized protein n=1 Tax=Myotis myotis TaxID=51298 RepID=A0A7J7ZXN9_MYOMY|nr:hypothetical protein mMyoMyo1_009722 [Myotis myotis]